MACSSNSTCEPGQHPEQLSDSTPTVHQHRLGTLTFNSASKQDLVNTVNRWMASQPTCVTANSSNIELDKSDNKVTHTTDKVEHSGFSIGYINPHVYNLSQQHDNVHEYLSSCNLVCIDGLGTSLALRAGNGLCNQTPVYRVVALNLFDALIKQLATPSNCVLIGVSKNEVEQSAANINRLNSAFNIIDVMDGFASESQYTQFLSIHHTIQCVLIGAGTPKSESIALLARTHCPNAIIFHIGAGTIKVYAGSKRRAPQWISDHGLEWVHRMIFEPHTRERYTRGAWQFMNHLFSTQRKPTSQKTRKLP